MHCWTERVYHMDARPRPGSFGCIGYGYHELSGPWTRTVKWKLDTVRTYKSSIPQLLPIERRQDITTNNDFQEFLKVMGTDSFKRLSNHDSDMDPLNEHLRSLGDNHSMNLVDLTAKTCFLLSVCGFLRADDLECVELSLSNVKDDDLELMVLFPKELRGGQKNIKPVIIKSHSAEAWCLVKAYVEYRRRTCVGDQYAKTTPQADNKIIHTSGTTATTTQLELGQRTNTTLHPRDHEVRSTRGRSSQVQGTSGGSHNDSQERSSSRRRHHPR